MKFKNFKGPEFRILFIRTSDIKTIMSCLNINSLKLNRTSKKLSYSFCYYQRKGTPFWGEGGGGIQSAYLDSTSTNNDFSIRLVPPGLLECSDTRLTKQTKDNGFPVGQTRRSYLGTRREKKFYTRSFRAPGQPGFQSTCNEISNISVGFQETISDVSV